ncbi:hypothetical protein HDU96_000379 [Phlyctochytrium bullatum]|nr:hypothetical protein HDU96_000379 [Phlyctochytrium bullatum]
MRFTTLSALVLAVATQVALASPIALVDKCAKRCPPSFAPVCASNGRTFASDCEVEVEACRTNNSKLFVAHSLGCTDVQIKKKDGCYEDCPASFAPTVVLPTVSSTTTTEDAAAEATNSEDTTVESPTLEVDIATPSPSVSANTTKFSTPAPPPTPTGIVTFASNSSSDNQWTYELRSANGFSYQFCELCRNLKIGQQAIDCEPGDASRAFLMWGAGIEIWRLLERMLRARDPRATLDVQWVKGLADKTTYAGECEMEVAACRAKNLGGITKAYPGACKA